MSWTDVYEYWNWPPSKSTPLRRKRTTFLEMKQVSSLSLQLMTMHDRQSSTELFVAVGVGGSRPFSLPCTHRPSSHSLIDGHVDEQECVIADQQVCNKEAARMKEQQAVEQRTRAEEATRMKERQEVEGIAMEKRARDEEAARMKEQQEEKHMIAEQRLCNKEAARMKEQQEVEQWMHAEEATSIKECVPLDGWWPMHFISLAWLAGCGSHPWCTKISAILWIYRLAAADMESALSASTLSQLGCLTPQAATHFSISNHCPQPNQRQALVMGI